MSQPARNQTLAPEDARRIGVDLRPPDGQQSLAIDGVLVTTVELDRRLGSYDPSDQVFGFRRDQSWVLMTLQRTERWSDDGVQRPTSGTARVLIEDLGLVESLAETIRDRYAESGWRELLDAGHQQDPDLFCAWVGIQAERDLEAAVFFRRDLAQPRGPLDTRLLAELRRDIGAHLDEAGFRVVAVDPPPRRTRRGEIVVVARAVVCRNGHEIRAIVRIDDVGEVYPRLVDADDDFGPALRDLADDGDA